MLGLDAYRVLNACDFVLSWGSPPVTVKHHMRNRNRNRSRILNGLLMAALVAGLLYAQEVSPATVQELQQTLARLQAEIKTLQDVVKKLSEDARKRPAAPAPSPAVV